MELFLTNAGQSLLYKVQGGKTLNFLRFGLGDGKLNGQAIQPLTNLINPKMSVELKRLDVKNDRVILGAFLDNKELTEGFYQRELGIFAEDPDTKAEILFMYANSADTSDYIDGNTGRVIEENLTVEIYISDVANISAVINESLVYALKSETGATVTATIDPNTYIMTIQLKNIDGTVLSEQQIDLPLETMVMDASYADGTLTLKLQNGTTVPIDISSIVSGLVPEGRTIAGIDLKDNITKAELQNALGMGDKENTSNKTTTLDENSTDTQYPSAKAVFEAIKNAGNVLAFENITVETSFWVEDTTYEEFGYKADISCEGVTAEYFSDVTFGVTEAISGNYAPISLTGAGTVTIYTVEQPESTIIIPSIICSKGA